VTTLLVPYHHDEPLPADDFPLPSADPVLVDLPAGDVWERMAALHEAVAEAVSARRPPTVVSGDCLVALGTLAGLQRRGLDPGIVWFDAHGDVHTLDTTTSGYLGGLSLRLALGAHPDLLARRLGLRPVPEARAVLVDARDLDPAEVDYLARSAIRRSSVADLTAADLPDGPLLLHVDVDVVSADALPGLRFPASHGPSPDEVVAACRRVAATGRVAAVDLACTWRPAGDGAALRSRADLLAALATVC
jgi:arginase